MGVTHDLAQMQRVAHHLVVVIGGRVMQQGDVDVVLAKPAPTVEAFLNGGAS